MTRNKLTIAFLCLLSLARATTEWEWKCVKNKNDGFDCTSVGLVCNVPITNLSFQDCEYAGDLNDQKFTRGYQATFRFNGNLPSACTTSLEEWEKTCTYIGDGKDNDKYRFSFKDNTTTDTVNNPKTFPESCKQAKTAFFETCKYTGDGHKHTYSFKFKEHTLTDVKYKENVPLDLECQQAKEKWLKTCKYIREDSYTCDTNGNNEWGNVKYKLDKLSEKVFTLENRALMLKEILKRLEPTLANAAKKKKTQVNVPDNEKNRLIRILKITANKTQRKSLNFIFNQYKKLIWDGDCGELRKFSKDMFQITSEQGCSVQLEENKRMRQ